MKVLSAIFMLTVNFFKSALISGFDTAKIIVLKPDNMESGLTEISYGDLSDNTAILLGAMITLTPGTTLVDINKDTGELVLHMLDLQSKEETLKIIQHDFCRYLKTLDEVNK